MTKYQNDHTLLHDLQAGEEQAVRYLFHLYYSSLRYLAAGIVQNNQEAEDIAIQSFQRFIEKKGGFTSLSAIRSFLFITVKNAGIDFIRKQRTRFKNEAAMEHTHSSIEDTEEEKMLEAKVLQLIYAEVEQLSPQCTTIFKAYFFEGKDTATIAQEMNISTQTVLNQKARAIQRLRNFIKKQGLFPTLLSIFPSLLK